MRHNPQPGPRSLPHVSPWRPVLFMWASFPGLEFPHRPLSLMLRPLCVVALPPHINLFCLVWPVAPFQHDSVALDGSAPVEPSVLFIISECCTISKGTDPSLQRYDQTSSIPSLRLFVRESCGLPLPAVGAKNENQNSFDPQHGRKFPKSCFFFFLILNIILI